MPVSGSGGTDAKSGSGAGSSPAAATDSSDGSLTASSASGAHVTIGLSAILAAIWGGIWGFNWAASHLANGPLFVTVIIGLGTGTALTVYAVEQSFRTVDAAIVGYATKVAARSKKGQTATDVPIPKVIQDQL